MKYTFQKALKWKWADAVDIDLFQVMGLSWRQLWVKYCAN